jgi:hypothetical protein
MPHARRHVLNRHCQVNIKSHKLYFSVPKAIFQPLPFKKDKRFTLPPLICFLLDFTVSCALATTWFHTYTKESQQKHLLNEWREEGIDLCQKLIDTDHDAVSVPMRSYSHGKKYLNSKGGSGCIKTDCTLMWQLFLSLTAENSVCGKLERARKPQFSLTFARVLTVHKIFI